jgi:ABC-2 type transport system permease protein
MLSAEMPVLVNSARQRPNIVREVRDVLGYYDLLANMVRRDLTVRYKRSVVGFFWTMLSPLVLMVILTIVFSTIFRFEGIQHYEVYFLSEFVVWGFFQQTTVTTMQNLTVNGALLKRVRLPKSIFAVATTLSGLANLCLACIPLLAIMLVRHAPISAAMLFLPVSFLIIGMFTLGVALGLSALAVYFDDVSQMYQVASTGWMYLTPIIYPMSIVPERFRLFINLNPLTHLFELTRMPIYQSQLPPLALVGQCLGIAVGTLLVGWVVFHRLARGFYLHV